MPVAIGCSKASIPSLPDASSDIRGESLDTFDIALTLEELPADSEKLDKDDIFTSRNERAAPSYYDVFGLSDIGEQKDDTQSNLWPQPLFIEKTFYQEKGEQCTINPLPSDQ